MAQEIREFPVTVPAGTPLASPVTVDVSFPERVVDAVSWRVPPGPSGLMGWRLTSAGTPVIPIQPDGWIVTDDDSSTWPLDDYLDSGNWQVTAYNTGAYDHTVYLTFLLDLPGGAVAPPSPPAGSGVGLVGSTGTVTVPAPASDGGALPATIPGNAPPVAVLAPSGAASQLQAAAAGQAGGGRITR